MAIKHDPLIATIQRHFRYLRCGHPNTREAEKRLLLGIAKNVCILSFNIRHFSELTENQIMSLIKHWQQRSNCTATVYHKLAVLRKHYRVVVVDNVLQQRKDIRPQSKLAPVDQDDRSVVTLSMIDDKYLRFLLAGQQWFGLTFKEVLHLHPGVLCEGYVKVLRLYAFNNHERHIAIRTPEQQQWIDNFCQQANVKTQTCAAITLIRQQRRVLASLGVPSNYFRYCYVRWRHAELLKQELSQRKILRQLRHELGYQRNVSVNRIIQWENKPYAMPNTVCIN